MSNGADAGKESQKRPLRVLVAEDFPVNQQIALRQVEKLGHLAEAAENGLLALEALKRMEFDVILMDCHMPEMDGYEATWQIREREKALAGTATPPKRVYIIAMTTSSDEQSREKCLNAGMDDFIRKPVQLPELEAALERATHSDGGAGASIAGVIDPVVIAGLRQLREPGKADPLVELIDLFLKDAPRRLTAIEEAIARNDVNTMSQVISSAISLKGGAANLGARKLASICGDIEKQVWQGVLSDVLPVLKEAKAEFARVKSTLEKIKAQPR